jgi:hypothetical protein
MLAAGACAVGNVPPGTMTDDGPERIPSGDESVEARLDGLDIICESTLLVTGTFAPGLAQPVDMMGCWPVGTWTLSATIDRLGCDPQPDFQTGEFAESWVYEVTYDEETTTTNMVFVNNPTDDRVNFKITTAGDSLCHGAMDHFQLDNTVIGFRPTLQLDGTLTGIGTYTVHEEDTF